MLTLDISYIRSNEDALTTNVIKNMLSIIYDMYRDDDCDEFAEQTQG